ncbi:MAG: hypothetical protein GAK35_01165 [Herbaspirillum frisingense]|uniref:DUF4156 domain-containing protein n=1 Tax=Herbaspirillum frisingense TaxID=92645 RepID=A0A7V8FYL4_9BURK|nr:MAG: hypothetical protein GAK35_01165 [Herbaspirillum frisingense]
MHPIAPRALLILAVMAALPSCSPIPVAGDRAAAVRLTHNEPAGCAFLGDVTGSQGNFLLGPITSNSDMETGARNDLKNKAAAMGGNVVYLLTQRAGVTTRRDHGE